MLIHCLDYADISSEKCKYKLKTLKIYHKKSSIFMKKKNFVPHEIDVSRVVQIFKKWRFSAFVPHIKRVVLTNLAVFGHLYHIFSKNPRFVPHEVVNRCVVQILHF